MFMVLHTNQYFLYGYMSTKYRGVFSGEKTRLRQHCWEYSPFLEGSQNRWNCFQTSCFRVGLVFGTDLGHYGKFMRRGILIRLSHCKKYWLYATQHMNIKKRFTKEDPEMGQELGCVRSLANSATIILEYYRERSRVLSFQMNYKRRKSMLL